MIDDYDLKDKHSGVVSGAVQVARKPIGLGKKRRALSSLLVILSHLRVSILSRFLLCRKEKNDDFCVRQPVQQTANGILVRSTC